MNLGTAARWEDRADAAVAMWDGMASVSGLTPAGASFSSRGHFVDGPRATVWVNGLAAAPYAARHSARRFPVGAVLVEKLGGDGVQQARALFIMTKQPPGSYPDGSDWDYVVAQPDGVLQGEGPLAGCARCHAEAPSDGVFGLP